MSEQRGAVCYLIQENKSAPVYLCVVDEDTASPVPNISRRSLAALLECAEVIHSAISGYSQKHAFQEVATLLSKQFGK